MALMINDECIRCAVCVPECPNEAIQTDADGQFFIRAGRCTECVGAFDAPHCQTLCPVPSAIVVNPMRAETREMLETKARRMKVRKAFDDMFHQKGTDFLLNQ